MVDKELPIESVQGISASSPSQFDFQNGLLAYTASGGVVVSSIKEGKVGSQRFFVASTSNSGINSTPTRNNFIEEENKKDEYGYYRSSNPLVVNGTSAAMNNIDVESISTTSLSPSKIKDKVRSISCVTLSPNKKLLAVGETGYSPRILIFSLAKNSIDSPVVIINDHSFGISHLSFSKDGRFLCSLGSINDGVINIWQTGDFQLICTNRCSSVINDVIWHEGYLITIGVRIIKVWQVEGERKSFLRGKNVILGKFLNCNFLSCSPLNHHELLIVANNNKLLILNLEESFNLSQLKTPKFEFNSVEVSEKVWFCSKNSVISCLTMEELCIIDKEHPDDLETSTKQLTQTSNKLLKYQDNLIYLRENGTLDSYNLSSKKSSPLINCLSKGLVSVKSHDNKIYSVNESGRVMCSGNKVLEFTIPTSATMDNIVTAMDVNEDLILGDRFGFLYFFAMGNDSNYELASKVKAHESSVTDIVLFDIDNTKYLTSISRDRMIQIFIQKESAGQQKWSLLQTIALHTANLLKVEYWNERIYVCSNDRTISIHHITDNITLEKTLSLKASPVLMKILNNEMIVSTVDRNLIIYDLNSLDSRNLRLSDGRNNSLLIENLTVYDSTIFVSSSDKSLRTFNYNNGKLLTTNFGHSDSVLYLAVEKEHLVSISSDGCIFQWGLMFATKLNESKSPTLADDDSNLSPLYAKVQRKILPTTPSRDRNLPNRELYERSNPSSPKKNITPSPSPRLTAATLKRIERSRSSSPTRCPPSGTSPMRNPSPTSKKTLLPPLSANLNGGNMFASGPSSMHSREFVSIREQVDSLKSAIKRANLREEEKQILIEDFLSLSKDLGYDDNGDVLREYSEKLVDIFRSRVKLENN
ncbi:hypothetical protein CLIB1444_09S04720 [[Candida] jaroonii]|uniref:Uncharacterized protein n=1 Tax=[Candida] jaroonii TaxID=467808 RepID=A0ACA9YC11_9ASCO|nr:hypothetical protein CLIB1444_09S04720 [[Candida] jaroonii]